MQFLSRPAPSRLLATHFSIRGATLDMIGTLNTSTREVTVVGAGIAGMLAAYSLDKNGYRVTLLEERKRGGGLLGTTQTRYGIAEAAANSILASPAV